MVEPCSSEVNYSLKSSRRLSWLNIVAWFCDRNGQRFPKQLGRATMWYRRRGLCHWFKRQRSAPFGIVLAIFSPFPTIYQHVLRIRYGLHSPPIVLVAAKSKITANVCIRQDLGGSTVWQNGMSSVQHVNLPFSMVHFGPRLNWRRISQAWDITMHCLSKRRF